MSISSKILIIEDNQLFGKTIERVLLSKGYKVCYADNGAAGIEKAIEFNPDLILCDINMYPIDGFQVYNMIKANSVFNQTPFIFITGNSTIENIRVGMDLGADDYLVKPFNNDSLIRSIELRLNKYRSLKEEGRKEFNVIFKNTPNGVFLFDKNSIFNANPALLRMLAICRSKISTLAIENILDIRSFLKIKENITKCSMGISDSFAEIVTLVSENKQIIDVELQVFAYDKHAGESLMVGLVMANQNKIIEKETIISEVFEILKKEKYLVSDYFSEKFTDHFINYNANHEIPQNNYFSEREQQVLSLSMEGLPMKIIADKLSISDRTVEKHRANLMEKTNSKNMIEVIMFALRNNLIEI